MSSAYSAGVCECRKRVPPPAPSPSPPSPSPSPEPEPCHCDSCKVKRRKPARTSESLPMPINRHANGVSALALPAPGYPPLSMPVFVCCENGTDVPADNLPIFSTIVESGTHNLCDSGVFEIDASVMGMDIVIVLTPPVNCTRNFAHFKRVDSNPSLSVKIDAGAGDIGRALEISLAPSDGFGAMTGESAMIYWNGTRFEIL